MSNRKSRKNQRSNQDYIQSAKRLAKFAPSLKKYSRRRTRLTKWEKAAIARKENALKYAHDLFPVTKKEAKKIKSKLYKPGSGIQAIQLRNTSDHAKIEIRKDGLIVTSNGRTWEYHEAESIDAPDIANLADTLFENGAKEIYLWTAHGRAGAGFRSLKQFMIWFQNNYFGYTTPDQKPDAWINGIAARFN